MWWLVALLLLLEGCDPYAKLAKQPSVAAKDSAAFGYLSTKNYEAAIPLLEELLNMYRGMPRGEEILFHLAYAHYYNKEYYLAAHYFEEYVNTYPTGKYTEEAQFMNAYCYYRLSAPPELDQSETYTAIEKLRLFLLTYPESDYKERAERYLQMLYDNLAQKAFNQAKLYYNLGYYKAAVVAFENMLKEHPDAPQREEGFYYLFLASVKLADNSVEEKQLQRYLQALENYYKFADRYPQSPLLKKIESYYEYLQRQIQAHQKDSTLSRR